MVLQYLVQNSKYAFRERDESQKIRVGTAAALLTSFIADADVITDWIYFIEIIHRDDEEEPVPTWVRVLQHASCICGTISYLAISSDGRLMDWIRQAVWYFAWSIIWVVEIIFYWIPAITINLITFKKISLDDVGWCFYIDETFDRARHKLDAFFDHGFRMSGGSLLMIGIFTEDVPQIIVTFLVEDAIGSLVGNEGISQSAYLNLIIAMFDILHKLAEAWDDRKLFIGMGTGIRTFIGHTNLIWSLTSAGMNQILSASWDGTARLWDIRSGRTIQTFDLDEKGWYGSIAKLGEERIVSTSLKDNGKIKIFDLRSGRCVKTIDDCCNRRCTVVSNDSAYILTSQKNDITGWDTATLEPVQTYKKRADCLLIIDNHRFISSNFSEGEEGYPTLWDVTSGNQLLYFIVEQTRENKITTMCKNNVDSFLVVCWNGHIRKTWIGMFAITHPEPIKTMTIDGKDIYSLTSVDDDRFVACATNSQTAKLWDFPTGTCLQKFIGHSNFISDIAYLPEQMAIATSSADQTVKLWQIRDCTSARGNTSFLNYNRHSGSSRSRGTRGLNLLEEVNDAANAIAL